MERPKFFILDCGCEVKFQSKNWMGIGTLNDKSFCFDCIKEANKKMKLSRWVIFKPISSLFSKNKMELI